MNFQTVFEELSSLYEGDASGVESDTADVDVEVEEGLLDTVKKVFTGGDDVNEGIFDSKKKKQQVYAQLVADVFDKRSPLTVALQLASSAEDTLHDTVDSIGDDNVSSAKAQAKNFIQAIKTALVAAKKNKWGPFNAIVAYVKKWAPNSTSLDDLVEFKNKNSMLKKEKGGYEASEYLMTLVNEQLEKRLTNTIKWLAKEHGIREALNEEEDVVDVTEPESESEVAVDEPRQVVLECSKCGGIIIKDEADITIDDETDLVNVGEECQYCEAADGYTVIGQVVPYEAEETVAEEDPDVIDEALENSADDREEDAVENSATEAETSEDPELD